MGFLRFGIPHNGSFHKERLLLQAITSLVRFGQPGCHARSLSTAAVILAINRAIGIAFDARYHAEYTASLRQQTEWIVKNGVDQQLQLCDLRSNISR